MKPAGNHSSQTTSATEILLLRGPQVRSSFAQERGRKGGTDEEVGRKKTTYTVANPNASRWLPATWLLPRLDGGAASGSLRMSVGNHGPPKELDDHPTWHPHLRGFCTSVPKKHTFLFNYLKPVECYISPYTFFLTNKRRGGKRRSEGRLYTPLERIGGTREKD